MTSCLGRGAALTRRITLRRSECGIKRRRQPSDGECVDGFAPSPRTRTLSTRIRCDGGADDPETHVSRGPLAVDEEGWTEITALVAAALEAVLRIHAEGASRQAEQGPDAPLMISTELAMMHFRHADTT